MRHVNKVLIYEVDDERISLDEGFDGKIEKNDYIVIDLHTLGEEIVDEISDKHNDIFISQIYKAAELISEDIKEKLISEAVDYAERNYAEELHM